jgi:molybdenum cofactor biosynthesis enzyme
MPLLGSSAKASFKNQISSHTGKAKVGDKPIVRRRAVAPASIEAQAQPISGSQLKKGDALAVHHGSWHRVFKKTTDLIPLCHPSC